MKLVIDRQKWLRGHGIGSASALLRESDRKMCCLGFHSLACGYKEDEIEGAPYPSSLLNRRVDKKLANLIPEWLVRPRGTMPTTESFDDSEEGLKLAHVNDTDEISDRVREKKLKKMFASHGVEVEFIN